MFKLSLILTTKFKSNMLQLAYYATKLAWAYSFISYLRYVSLTRKCGDVKKINLEKKYKSPANEFLVHPLEAIGKLKK